MGCRLQEIRSQRMPVSRNLDLSQLLPVRFERVG